MANARAQSIDLHQKSIRIAIGSNIFHHKPVTRRLALKPQLIPGPAKKRSKASLNRLPKSFFIHIPNHQNAASSIVLNHGSDQAIHLLKIKIHSVQ
jgi:hypothetical protein